MILGMPAYFSLTLYIFMRKTFFFSLLLIGLGLVFCFSSCKDKQKPKGPAPTVFEQSMTNQDSIEVTHLVTSFFDNVKSGDLDAAVAMLYHASSDSTTKEARPLNNSEMKSEKIVLNSIPILSYHIDYLKFSEYYNNEVKVTVKMAEAQGDTPAMTTVFYFRPVKNLDKWYLCVMDSHNGDIPVIEDVKRDSMTKEYAKEMKAKKMKSE